MRGLNPWPCAFSFLNGKRFVIDFAYVEKGEGKAGEVLSADKDGIVIACGKDAVRLKTVKFEGKKKMTAEEYLRGHSIEKGTLLGKD